MLGVGHQRLAGQGIVAQGADGVGAVGNDVVVFQVALAVYDLQHFKEFFRLFGGGGHPDEGLVAVAHEVVGQFQVAGLFVHVHGFHGNGAHHVHDGGGFAQLGDVVKVFHHGVAFGAVPFNDEDGAVSGADHRSFLGVTDGQGRSAAPGLHFKLRGRSAQCLFNQGLVQVDHVAFHPGAVFGKGLAGVVVLEQDALVGKNVHGELVKFFNVDV